MPTKGIWFTVLVVSLTTIAISFIKWIFRRRPGEGAEKPGPGNGDLVRAPTIPKVTPLTLSVVAIGPSGSGKTVMLASMYNTLQVASQQRPYLLAAGLADRNYLSSRFSQITDDEEWPPGTRKDETRKFDFDCKSALSGNRHSILRIEYHDYAGELLQTVTDTADVSLADLEQRIVHADALLGIIDGWHVRQFMLNEQDGRRKLRASIGSIVGILAEHQAPMQLIITKWDLVRDFGEPSGTSDDERLSLVGKRLAAETRIGELVGTCRNNKRVLRLIPVSAVGSHFAQPERGGAGYRIVKLPDGQVRPTNIEVPLAAVIPDLLRARIMSMDARNRAEIEQNIKNILDITPHDTLAAIRKLVSVPTGVAVRWTLGTISGSDFYASRAADQVVQWLSGPLDAKVSKGHQISAEAHEYLRELEEARDGFIEAIGCTLASFDERYPSSMLIGKW